MSKPMHNNLLRRILALFMIILGLRLSIRGDVLALFGLLFFVWGIELFVKTIIKESEEDSNHA